MARKSDHPNVKILQRTYKSTGKKTYKNAGKKVFLARWKDPETGKPKEISLTGLGLTKKEARRQWAIRKSKAIGAQRAKIAAREEDDEEREKRETKEKAKLPVSIAVEEYVKSCRNRLRDSTVAAYSSSLDVFIGWAVKEEIRLTGQLTGPKLTSFREWLLAQRRRLPAKGEPQGAKKTTKERKSPYTTNYVLRAVKTMLGHWRRSGLVPKLSRDTISDSLQNLTTPKTKPVFLRHADLRRLLQACLRHDSEKFKITREEHDGLRQIGSTPRYDPIGPLITFLLLSGCRLGEALHLKWLAVDFEALDESGEPVGEIRLEAEITKTHSDRLIDLSVSPGLRALLSALHLRRGQDEYVFSGSSPLSKEPFTKARKRLINSYGASSFDSKHLRKSTATYLTNAPGIFGAASAWRSANQLGHSVQVAQKHYLGLLRGIPHEARNLEDAMQIKDLIYKIVARISGGYESGDEMGQRVS